MKIIMARAEQFGRYASEWFEDLILFQRAYLERRNDVPVDVDVDSFMVDMFLMYLKWVAVPESADAVRHAKELLRACLRRCEPTEMSNDSSNASVIMRNNAVIIFLLIKKWNKYTVHFIPEFCEDVLQKMKSDSPDPGLFCLEAILAAGGAIPLKATHGFFQALLNILGNASNGKVTTTTVNAAKCLGALQFPDEAKSDLRKSVSKALVRLRGRSATTGDHAFLLCVYKMSINGNPDFSGHFVPDLHGMLSQLPRDSKVVALRTIVICCNDLQDIIKNVQSSNLKNYLAHDDPETQAAALEILFRGVGDISTSEYTKWIMDYIEPFRAHLSAPHRLAYYKVLGQLRRKLCDLQTPSEEEMTLLNRVEQLLLYASADPADAIRAHMLTYWDIHGNLGNSYLGRMSAALKTM